MCAWISHITCFDAVSCSNAEKSPVGEVADLLVKSAMLLAGPVCTRAYSYCPQLRILAIFTCSKVARRVSTRKAECGTYLLVFSWKS